MSARTDDAPIPVRYLTCACCGEETRGRQWRNRDAGYGVCARCADANTDRYGEGSKEETAADPMSYTTRNLYGIRGWHFAVPGDWRCAYCGNDERHEASNTCTLCGRIAR